MLSYNYMLPSEIGLFAPQVSGEDALQGDGALNFITVASSTIEAYCGWSLWIRDVIAEEVTLDRNLTGRLLNRPFIRWLSTTVDLFRFGDKTSLGSLNMNDFSVYPKPGIIRNLESSPISIRDSQFISNHGTYSSPYLGVISDYYVGAEMAVYQNSKPYTITVDYRAGFCTEKDIGPSGLVDGATEVIVSPDVTDLQVGDEFYFDLDPANEPTISTRYITSLDSDTNTVGFRPALGYGSFSTATLRKIPRVLRSACADIIADMQTFPAGVKSFTEGLGRANLYNSWTKDSNLSGIPISSVAVMKLANFTQ